MKKVHKKIEAQRWYIQGYFDKTYDGPATLKHANPKFEERWNEQNEKE